MQLKKKFYICILILILLTTGSIAAILCTVLSGKSTCTAYIYQNGQLLYELPLNHTLKELRIQSPEGGFNLISVRDGAIGITAADCPDQICVHQGFIRTSLLPITCLPHGLVIQVQSEPVIPYTGSQPDMITH